MKNEDDRDEEKNKDDKNGERNKFNEAEVNEEQGEQGGGG